MYKIRHELRYYLCTKKQEGYSWQRITATQTIQTKTQIQRTALILPMRTHRIRTKTQTRTAAMRQTAKTAEGLTMLLMSQTVIKPL